MSEESRHIEINARKLPSNSFVRRSWMSPDDRPFSVFKGDIEQIENFSAHDVLMPQDDDGHIGNRRKSYELKSAQINRRINNAPITNYQIRLVSRRTYVFTQNLLHSS